MSEHVIDNESELEEKQEAEPRNFGGWLILLAIGLVVSPFRLIFYMYFTYPPIFTDGTWEEVTTEGSAFYSPLWGPYIIGEIALNIVMVFLAFTLMYLFFSKKSAFPKWYGGASIYSVVFILVDAYFVTLVSPTENMFDKEVVQELLRGFISLAIWTPYLFLSDRAQETFVR